MMQSVLLAEDEPLIALSFEDLLEAEGYQVVLAADGAEALAKAVRMNENGVSPAALVTDLNMPRVRGEELIREIRRSIPELPVVVVTGAAPSGGEAELQRQGGGSGPLALLLKPVALDQLSGVLRSFVGQGT